MNILRAIFITVVMVSCIIPSQSQARLMTVLTYQELLNKSDLVIIAAPKSKTTDTKEEAFLPNIWRQDPEGKQSKRSSLSA